MYPYRRSTDRFTQCQAHSQSRAWDKRRLTKLCNIESRDLLDSFLQSNLEDTKSQMARYAATTIENSKSARARGSHLRVSFKNTRETAQAINGLKLQRAVKYLEHVKEKREAIPMRRYAGSTGRTAQG